MTIKRDDDLGALGDVLDDLARLVDEARSDSHPTRLDALRVDVEMLVISCGIALELLDDLDAAQPSAPVLAFPDRERDDWEPWTP